VADDPDLPVRPAGASAAAVAGARAGVGVAPPDVYDPDRIRAALRGDQGRTEQSSRQAGDPGVLTPAAADASPGHDQPAEPDTSPAGGAGWGATPGWDAVPDPHVTSANGNHVAQAANRGPFDAAFTGTADSGAGAEAQEDFSWLKADPPQPAPADHEPSSWSSPVGQEPSSWSARTDSGLASRPETGSVTQERDVTQRLPRYEAESLAAQERTDFWAKPTPSSPAPSVPSDLRPPSASRAEEPTITRASWPSAAETTAPPAAEPAHRVPAATGATAGSGTAQAGSGSQPLSPPGAAGQPAHAGRPDRYFPVRLLVVIIIAALIGSALVLLLK
jgi:hypothetical protein